MARPTPVLPEVGSMIVPPGLSSPSRSAPSIIAMAMRSLTLPPGLSISSLASTSQRASGIARRIRTSGVFPTRSRTESATSTDRRLPAAGWNTSAAFVSPAGRQGGNRDLAWYLILVN